MNTAALNLYHSCCKAKFGGGLTSLRCRGSASGTADHVCMIGSDISGLPEKQARSEQDTHQPGILSQVRRDRVVGHLYLYIDNLQK